MILTFLPLGLVALLISCTVLHLLKDKMPLKGEDAHKPGKPKLPEAMGLCSAISFIVTLFLFLLFQPLDVQFYKYLAISSSCTFTVLLGFIDDVLDLEWRYKIIFPAVSTIPTLLLYSEGTRVIVPLVGLLDIGGLYYVYMIVCCTFATNAINILSGINGLEVSQVLIISGFMMADNVMRQNSLGTVVLFILICSAVPLFWFNAFPASVLVGDNFCYFSGMVLGCVAILTHTTRTLFLLMGIQVFNFVLSLPQLYGAMECPRHRMPDFDGSNLIYSRIKHKGKVTPNLTVLNTILYVTGPMKEKDLCEFMVALQTMWCGLVILLKYFLYNGQGESSIKL